MNEAIQRHLSNIQADIEKTEKEANASFAKSTLDDFGQILANSVAYETSIHRVRLAKMQELSGIPPQYHNTRIIPSSDE
ncbi:hypothetical protein TRFO_21313 [Tritrichomonas foetus]|uniref:Uncharacterized protein n=1 Tax=Tritrichomonas foetus TaxID=1144522 RepID=A0A1J4KJ40_9EUKA|nr:hypothetical protein TRFO_21313 [Tritrichomonas foetus]|eukprot:OHT09694.1 hypothetical protein TRFO_21313 [Tritrichomonas foetus]